jgi:GT2 family glycosyltransferase
MKVLVVILCYKVPDLTIDCLRSLSDEVERVPGTRVAVCENGTGGDSAVRIKQAIEENGWGPWVDFTEVYPNRGFTGGNNLVIREALQSSDPPEYVWMLNADTIVRPESLVKLVEFMDAHPQAGIAASQLLTPQGTLQPSPYRYLGVLNELDRGLKLRLFARLIAPWVVSPPTPTHDSVMDWAAGASMILRRTLLEEIGLLDEGLYSYFDDLDICLRARRAGWENWFIPESVIVHLGGATTGLSGATIKRMPDYWFQARRRFFLKNYGAFYTAMVDAAYLSGSVLFHLRRKILRRPDNDHPHLLYDSFRHSVFLTGFEVRVVENPAMAQAATPVMTAS